MIEQAALIAIGSLLGISGFFLKRLIDSTDEFKKETRAEIRLVRDKIHEVNNTLMRMDAKIYKVEEGLLEMDTRIVVQVNDLVHDYMKDNFKETEDIKDHVGKLVDLYGTVNEEIKKSQEAYGKVQVLEGKLDTFLQILKNRRGG